MKNNNLAERKRQFLETTTTSMIYFRSAEDVFFSPVGPVLEAYEAFRAQLYAHSPYQFARERSRLARLREHVGHLAVKDLHLGILTQMPRAVRKTEPSKRAKSEERSGPAAAAIGLKGGAQKVLYGRSQKQADNRQPLSVSTVLKLQKLLRSALRHLNNSLLCPALQGCLNSHPVLTERLIRGGRGARRERLPENVLGAICAQLPRRDHQIALHLLVQTGLRLNELFNMTWGDVLEQRTHIRVTDRGGGRRSKVRERALPLTDQARQLIAELEHQRGQLIDRRARLFKFGIRALQQAFTRAKRRAGYPGVRLHDARRECVSRLTEQGRGLDSITAITGHQDLQTIRRHYMCPEPQRLAQMLQHARPTPELSEAANALIYKILGAA